MSLIKFIKNSLKTLRFLNPFYLSKKLKYTENRIKKLDQKCKNLDFLLKNQFLKEVTGVIHVGANTGQERFLYQSLDLDVIWIEPIPEVYKILSKNIKSMPKQKVINSLITDEENKLYKFNITDNKGLSSSIFELNLHKKLWPEIQSNKFIKLKSTTLDSIFKKKDFDIDKYQTLIMDTQGSELLVLNGCKSILNKFLYIKTEVANFEAYTNCCKLEEMNKFMNSNGFFEVESYVSKEDHLVGKYYDILYKNNN